MNTFYPLLFIAISTVIGYAQQGVEFDQPSCTKQSQANLAPSLEEKLIDSLQQATGKITRIHTIIATYTLTDASKFKYRRHFVNSDTKESFLFEIEADVRGDLYTIEEVEALPIGKGVDCFPITIEIEEDQQHYSRNVGCNRSVYAKINKIFPEVISDEITAFKQQLPSGVYLNGMTTFIVNQPIRVDAEKASFYKRVEAELKQEGIACSNPLEQPVIVINGETSYFADINRLKEEELVAIHILKGAEATALYGSRAIHGVVLIETMTKGKNYLLSE